MALNGAGAGDAGAWVVAEGVGTERGGTAPEGGGALNAVVVGVAVVVTDGAVAVTDDAGDASTPTTRGRRG